MYNLANNKQLTINGQHSTGSHGKQQLLLALVHLILCSVNRVLVAEIATHTPRGFVRPRVNIVLIMMLIFVLGTPLSEAQINKEHAHSTSPGTPVGPTDPECSPGARKLYEYLQSLGPKKTEKMLSGQYFNNIWSIYDENVVGLYRKTGKWPAVLQSTFDNWGG